MALKDLYKYAKQQEEAGKAPAGAKSSLEILVDAREKGIKGARSVGGVTTSDLKRQISAAKTTADATIVALTEEKAKLEAELTTLTANLESVNAQFAEAQSALQASASTQSAAEATIASLTEEKVTLEAAIAELTTNLDAVNAQLENADATICALIDEKAKLEADLEHKIHHL